MPRQRASQIWIDVVTRGPLFSKKITPVVKNAIVKEVMERIEQEMETKTARLIRKKGKSATGRPLGLGAKRNPIEVEKAFGNPAAIELGFATPTNSPRTKGTTWQRKNVAWIRKLSPGWLKRAADRIAGELT